MLGNLNSRKCWTCSCPSVNHLWWPGGPHLDHVAGPSQSRFSPTCCLCWSQLCGRRFASECYAVTLMWRVRGKIKLKKERRSALWCWAAKALLIFNPTRYTVVCNRDIWWNMELSCECDTVGGASDALLVWTTHISNTFQMILCGIGG